MDKHTAWRSLGRGIGYVESISKPGERGDKYSYTGDASKALRMTEQQCRAFCAYMKACGTVGFWA